MSKTTVLAAEATTDEATEMVSYELAFHLLPTVAEAEVPKIEASLASIITDAGGVTGEAEPAQPFTLAYEIKKMVNGTYRRFDQSYFGWLRFTALATAVGAINEAVEARQEVLRSLVTRLTRQEVAHPFYLHEALAARQTVTDIDLTTTEDEATNKAVSAAPEAEPTSEPIDKPASVGADVESNEADEPATTTTKEAQPTASLAT